ncbi:MAG: PAS domain S-box protein [Verrucomicrobia bacterium]|nr:PAS domain S-box protein [Verrucomicrobiota bacterium]
MTPTEIFIQDTLLLLSLAATGALVVFSFTRRIWPARTSSEWEKASPRERRRWARNRGLIVGTLYFVAGGFWILFSDQFVVEMFESDQLKLLANTLKGTGFVAVTAVLLGWLAMRSLREVVTTEAKLRVSEEQFRRVFEHSATGMILISLDGKFQAVNQAFCHTLGYTAAELVGIRFADITHPDDLPACNREIQELLAGQHEVLHVEKRFRHKSGRLVWTSETGSLIRDDQGQPQFFVIQAEDITERRTAQEALRQSEQRLRQIIDLVPFYIFAKDREGRFVLVNQTGAQAYGASVAELTGKTDADFARDPEEARRFREDDLAVIRSGQRKEIPEEKITAADGTVHYLTTVKIPYAYASAAKDHILGVAVDITEQKRAETALRELSARLLQAQDEERRRIARELHDTTAQELAALNMNLARLRRADLGSRDKFDTILQESIALAEKSAQKVRTLSYLLHPPELDTLGLPGAIREYAAGLARRSGVRVDVTTAPDLGRLPREMEIALFRIVQEGLGNILRHAASETAQIQLRRPDHRIVLEIQDQGRGIPAETLAKIQQRRGTGVGLAGMRERLHQLGGHFELQSSPAGTTIRATVPFPVKPA